MAERVAQIQHETRPSLARIAPASAAVVPRRKGRPRRSVVRSEVEVLEDDLLQHVLARRKIHRGLRYDQARIRRVDFELVREYPSPYVALKICVGQVSAIEGPPN